MALRSVKMREVSQEKVVQTSKVMFVLRREKNFNHEFYISSKPLREMFHW